MQTPVSLILNMHLLKYKPQWVKPQKIKCSSVVGSRSFFIPDSSFMIDAENWRLDIPLWPCTRRAVMVRRGLKVRKL